MTTFRDLFYCYNCNMCKHYACCKKEHCQETCSDTHLCLCGGTLERPRLTSDQQEDLIRCIPTAGDEVELCIAIKKLGWMNLSTYMLSACDNAIHNEGFPYSTNMINLFANWDEFEQASQYDVSMEEIIFLTNALITAEHCSDFMHKAIIFGTICEYLVEHPSILHRSKRCRDTVLDKVCDLYVFTGKQKIAILAAAAEEGGIMDQNRYDTVSWVQATIMNLLELPVYA